MSWRTKKRLTYLSVFFLIILLISFLIYLKLQKPKEQCFNNRQDQNEEDVDCGGPCPPCELKYFQPLKVYQTKYLIYLDKTFDLVGVIENPNPNLALKKLRYQFLIYDLDDNLKIKTPIEETVLLPLEKRYLVSINNPDPGFSIGKVELKIFEPQQTDWLKKDFEKLPINYYNEKIIQENGRWQMSLTLFNYSYLAQSDIETIILLYNDSNLVGLSKAVYSLKPQETKNIVLALPKLLQSPTGFEIHFQRTIFEE